MTSNNEINEWNRLELSVSKVFTPAAPIDQVTLFSGRIQQVREIVSSVNQVGQHAIIFGERGVGKTSLANVLYDLLKPLFPRSLIVSKVNCDVADNYSSLWKKVFRQIAVSRPKRGAGFIAQTTQEQIDLVQILGEPVSPDGICRTLKQLRPHTLIIIDEVDRLTNKETCTLLADTVKTLSDYSVNSTLVLVGVADSVDDLIKEHQSIDRSLVQVHMPRMSITELNEIIHKALKQLDMEIENDGLNYISALTQGLPHYAHLLGQLSAYKAIDSKRRTIRKCDVAGSVNDAIHKTQQSISSAYHRAVMSTRKGTLYPQVLLACALAPIDSMGYFAASDVRGPMSIIMKKRYEIPAFSRHLNDLCETIRGPIFQKIGTKRRFRFRFANPLMQPYIIMQGLASNLIDEVVVKKSGRILS